MRYLILFLAFLSFAATFGDVRSGDTISTVESATVSGNLVEFTTSDNVVDSGKVADDIVTGPASSTDNAVARFDSTTGKIIQNSGVIIDDSNNVTGLGTLNTHTIPSGTNTFALGSGAVNRIAYWSGTNTLTSASTFLTDGTNLRIQYTSGTIPNVVEIGSSTVNGHIGIGGWACVGSMRSGGGSYQGGNCYAKSDTSAENNVARVRNTHATLGSGVYVVGETGDLSTHEWFGQEGSVTADDQINTTDNKIMRLEVPASADTSLIVYGKEGLDSALWLYADNGDDTADRFGFQSHAGNTLGIYNGVTEIANFTSAGALSIDAGLTSTTVDTGQGANELYQMDQDVKTNNAVEFASVRIDPNGTGVSLDSDGDGMLILLGAGNGNDEDLRINLDDGAGGANTAEVTSTTGVTRIDFTSIGAKWGAAVEHQTSAYFDAEVSQTPSGAFTVDWTTGNKQVVTITGAALDVTFTDPSGPTNLILRVVQGDGSDTIDWTNEASIKWAGGVAPTLSTTAADIDIISCYYNSAVYYCVPSLDFA